MERCRRGPPARRPVRRREPLRAEARNPIGRSIRCSRPGGRTRCAARSQVREVGPTSAASRGFVDRFELRNGPDRVPSRTCADEVSGNGEQRIAPRGCRNSLYVMGFLYCLLARRKSGGVRELLLQPMFGPSRPGRVDRHLHRASPSACPWSSLAPLIAVGSVESYHV